MLTWLFAVHLAWAGSAELTGSLRFQADYKSSEGQIPAGTSKVRKLYLCAYDVQGSGQDFATHGRHYDDRKLGCATGTANGDYSIELPGLSDPTVDLYLVTWFCDADDSGSRSEAEVCVRVNAVETDEQTPNTRKYLWTRTYADTPLASLGSTPLHWNLSCPNKAGLGSEPSCSDREAEATAGDSGSQNSTTGWTKEFIHAHRAAIEPIRSFGSQKPSYDTVNGTPCDDDTCQDEINLYVHDSKPAGAEPFWSGCQGRTSKSNNSSVRYDGICLTTPNNAYRVVHEIGHNVHRRWLAGVRNLSDGAECGNWDEDVDQKCAVTEGWANFFSSAAWHKEDDDDPTYDQHDIEDPKTLPGCDEAPHSEGHVAQYLWDLYDSRNSAGEDDRVNHSFKTIRKIWSLFPKGDGNHGAGEDGDDGRNMKDFHYWYRRQFTSKEDKVEDLMASNCMDRHSD